jgi:hypothetical protein
LVARALLAKTTLSAKALDKLVGRSVDDVKVNAPFPLAMHRQTARRAGEPSEKLGIRYLENLRRHSLRDKQSATGHF